MNNPRELLKKIVNEPVNKDIPESRLEVYMRKVIEDSMFTGDVKTLQWIVETIIGRPPTTQIIIERQEDELEVVHGGVKPGDMDLTDI